MNIRFFQGWTDQDLKLIDIQFFRITLGLDDCFSLMIIILNFGIHIDIG